MARTPSTGWRRPNAGAGGAVHRSGPQLPRATGSGSTSGAGTGRSTRPCPRPRTLPPRVYRLPRRPVPGNDLPDRGAAEHLAHRPMAVLHQRLLIRGPARSRLQRKPASRPATPPQRHEEMLNGSGGLGALPRTWKRVMGPGLRRRLMASSSSPWRTRKWVSSMTTVTSLPAWRGQSLMGWLATMIRPLAWTRRCTRMDPTGKGGGGSGVDAARAPGSLPRWSVGMGRARCRRGRRCG